MFLPSLPTTIADELGIALGNLADAATGTVTPTLRLGVTGLSRAGKTIFITALIHNLLTGARLPGLAPMAEGRLIGARLAEHPDNATPLFPYENHPAARLGTPQVRPAEPRPLSQPPPTLPYQSATWTKPTFAGAEEQPPEPQ